MYIKMLRLLTRNYDVAVNQKQLFLFYCNRCKRFNMQQVAAAINCQLKACRILLAETIYY